MIADQGPSFHRQLSAPTGRDEHQIHHRVARVALVRRPLNGDAALRERVDRQCLCIHSFLVRDVRCSVNTAHRTPARAHPIRVEACITAPSGPDYEGHRLPREKDSPCVQPGSPVWTAPTPSRSRTWTSPPVTIWSSSTSTPPG